MGQNTPAFLLIVRLGYVKMAGGEWKLRGGVLTQNSYILEGFHFHWGENKMTGSEHFVDGRQFPLEVSNCPPTTLPTLVEWHISTVCVSSVLAANVQHI